MLRRSMFRPSSGRSGKSILLEKKSFSSSVSIRAPKRDHQEIFNINLSGQKIIAKIYFTRKQLKKRRSAMGGTRNLFTVELNNKC